MDKHLTDYLLSKANITSVGMGEKYAEGRPTGTPSLTCGATVKLPKASVAPRDLVPPMLDGYMTDVVRVGVLRAPPPIAQETRQKFRPAPGGCSIGHRDITAGTLGCYVRLADGSGDYYILSNNHVLANTNAGAPGDPIYQPGPYDGGNSGDTLCTLHSFVPIDFGGGTDAPDCSVASAIVGLLNGLARAFGRKHRVKSYIEAADNLVDCAIAGPVAPKDVLNEILTIGALLGANEVEIGEMVVKHGRTTDYTSDHILQIDVTADVQYGAGQVARFTDQLLAGPMSAGGDSGSALVNVNSELVGLLFAGSDDVTIFNKIYHVFDALGVML